jgi:hypothetical protein
VGRTSPRGKGKMMRSEPKLLQVIPADGWRASLVECDYDNGPRHFDEPLVGWTLIEDGEGDRTLEGMLLASGLDYAIPTYRVFSETNEMDRLTMFLGYLKPGEDLERYQEEAERTYALWRASEEKNQILLEAGGTEHGHRWKSPDGRAMNRRQALEELQGRVA